METNVVPRSAVRDRGIAVRGLSYSYRTGGEELFGRLDHAFVPSALTVITGASGRGKSTLLYVLGLMLLPRRGEVLIDGRAVQALPDAERSHIRAREIGFVFQDASLDPARTIIDSVVEPSLYAGGRKRDMTPRALELLEHLGLAARAYHRPGEISGGQAQRVAIARALINNPQLILADEPTGNLDEENTNTVLNTLTAAAHDGRTVILATHDPRVVARADAVLRL
jgi:ABC-type lipoprotein export system ATPase subunit